MLNPASKQGSERLPLKLTIIVSVIVLMLAVANELTSEKIAFNEALKSNNARQQLFSDSGGFEKVDFELSEDEAKFVGEIYAATGSAEDILGYCLDVTCKGFGGDVLLIIGVDLDGCITGVQLISHSETPGIGAVAVASGGELLSQFSGATASSIENVTAVSGATVSSSAVKDGITKALTVAGRLLKEGY